MSEIIIRIRDKRKREFMQTLLHELDFVEVIDTKEKKKISTGIKHRLRQGFKAVRLHEAGKIKLRSGKEILNDL